MNANPFTGPQESLPLFVYRNIQQPDESAIQRGFTGALVLMLLVLTLFAIARLIGRDRSRRRAGVRRVVQPGAQAPPSSPSTPCPRPARRSSSARRVAPMTDTARNDGAGEHRQRPDAEARGHRRRGRRRSPGPRRPRSSMPTRWPGDRREALRWTSSRGGHARDA